MSTFASSGLWSTLVGPTNVCTHYYHDLDLPYKFANTDGFPAKNYANNGHSPIIGDACDNNDTCRTNYNGRLTCTDLNIDLSKPWKVLFDFKHRQDQKVNAGKGWAYIFAFGTYGTPQTNTTTVQQAGTNSSIVCLGANGSLRTATATATSVQNFMYDSYTNSAEASTVRWHNYAIGGTGLIFPDKQSNWNNRNGWVDCFRDGVSVSHQSWTTVAGYSGLENKTQPGGFYMGAAGSDVTLYWGLKNLTIIGTRVGCDQEEVLVYSRDGRTNEITHYYDGTPAATLSGSFQNQAFLPSTSQNYSTDSIMYNPHTGSGAIQCSANSIRVADIWTYPLLQTDMEVDFWALLPSYTLNTDTTAQFFAITAGPSSYTSLGICLSTDVKTCTLYCGSSTTTAKNIDYTQYFNTWVHHLIRYNRDNTTVSWYINDELVTSVSKSSSSIFRMHCLSFGHRTCGVLATDVQKSYTGASTTQKGGTWNPLCYISDFIIRNGSTLHITPSDTLINNIYPSDPIKLNNTAPPIFSMALDEQNNLFRQYISSTTNITTTTSLATATTIGKINPLATKPYYIFQNIATNKTTPPCINCWTMSFWFKIDNVTQSESVATTTTMSLAEWYPTIATTTYPYRRLTLTFNKSDNTAALTIYRLSSNTSAVTTTTTLISDNIYPTISDSSWHHVAAVSYYHDDSCTNIYLDGQSLIEGQEINLALGSCCKLRTVESTDATMDKKYILYIDDFCVLPYVPWSYKFEVPTKPYVNVYDYFPDMIRKTSQKLFTTNHSNFIEHQKYNRVFSLLHFDASGPNDEAYTYGFSTWVIPSKTYNLGSGYYAKSNVYEISSTLLWTQFNFSFEAKIIQGGEKTENLIFALGNDPYYESSKYAYYIKASDWSLQRVNSPNAYVGTSSSIASTTWKTVHITTYYDSTLKTCNVAYFVDGNYKSSLNIKTESAPSTTGVTDTYVPAESNQLCSFGLNMDPIYDYWNALFMKDETGNVPQAGDVYETWTNPPVVAFRNLQITNSIGQQYFNGRFWKSGTTYSTTSVYSSIQQSVDLKMDEDAGAVFISQTDSVGSLSDHKSVNGGEWHCTDTSITLPNPLFIPNTFGTYSMRFVQGTQSMLYNTNPLCLPNDQDFTIEMILNIESVLSDAVFFRISYSSTVYMEFGYQTSDDTEDYLRMIFTCRNNSKNKCGCDSLRGLHHIALSYIAAESRFYMWLDGKALNTNYWIEKTNQTVTIPIQPMIVSLGKRITDAQCNWTGSISEFKIMIGNIYKSEVNGLYDIDIPYSSFSSYTIPKTLSFLYNNILIAKPYYIFSQNKLADQQAANVWIATGAKYINDRIANHVILDLDNTTVGPRINWKQSQLFPTMRLWTGWTEMYWNVSFVWKPSSDANTTGPQILFRWNLKDYIVYNLDGDKTISWVFGSDKQALVATWTRLINSTAYLNKYYLISVEQTSAAKKINIGCTASDTFPNNIQPAGNTVSTITLTSSYAFQPDDNFQLGSLRDDANEYELIQKVQQGQIYVALSYSYTKVLTDWKGNSWKISNTTPKAYTFPKTSLNKSTLSGGTCNLYAMQLSNKNTGRAMAYMTNTVLSSSILPINEDWTISYWRMKYAEGYLTEYEGYEAETAILLNYRGSHAVVKYLSGGNYYFYDEIDVSTLNQNSSNKSSTFYHVAIVNDGSKSGNNNLTVYEDGKYVETRSFNKDIDVLNELEIGIMHGDSGFLDDFFVIRGVKLWEDEFVPPSIPLCWFAQGFKGNKGTLYDFSMTRILTTNQFGACINFKNDNTRNFVYTWISEEDEIIAQLGSKYYNTLNLDNLEAISSAAFNENGLVSFLENVEYTTDADVILAPERSINPEKWNQYCLNCNGSTGITFASKEILDWDGNYTISFWSYGFSNGANTVDALLYIKNFHKTIGLYNRQGTYNACVRIIDDIINVNEEAVYTYGQWNHIAIVNQKGNFKIYINGKTAYTRTLSEGQSIRVNNLIIGHSPINNTSSAGYIDDIYISRSVLWEDEFTPPTEALVLIDPVTKIVSFNFHGLYIL